MKAWVKHPLIYEINTWVWLRELGLKYRKSVDLATVPEQEWDAIAANGLDAVWFMGVWERSPAGIGVSMQNAGLIEDFRRALPDFSAGDNVGSPYCVRRYAVDEHLGGPQGLAAARSMLRERGLRLILDFVPNHVAPDHPWVRDHPEYFVQGNADVARKDPASFIEAYGKVFACGRDPYFPAWPDVLQLNAFQPGLRQAVIETVSNIAAQCDGIRCDMAMLMLNNIFERTWGDCAGVKPVNDYWTTVIPAIKKECRSSGSLPRHTGTLSGSCSSRVLTTATTRNSTTGWNMTLPRACGCISLQTLLIRSGWSGSSRTTTSREPLPHFLMQKGAPPL